MSGIDDEDDDLPLADWPEKKEAKAGDPDTNRARDMMHLDPRPVMQTRQRNADDMGMPSPIRDKQPPPAATLPDDAPVVVAWKAFLANGYDKAISNFDLFMAGWTARDSQPKE